MTKSLRIEAYKPTQDDWHPSYYLASPGAYTPHMALVRVSLSELWAPTNNARWRVAVCGADDTRLERDFELQTDALEVFYTLVAMEFVNWADVVALNFTRG